LKIGKAIGNYSFTCLNLIFNKFSNFRNSTLIEKNIVQKIISNVVLIALGKQNRIYIKDLSTHLYWEEKSQLNFREGYTTKDITVRDLIKMSLAELGIEIEFCGRGELEKGVIIDLDEERLELLKIDKESLKFGQTVVKIDDQSPVSIDENRTMEKRVEQQNIGHFETEFHFDNYIKEVIMSNLLVVKKHS
jgi:GDPmannose 4,6-dehydratase